MRHVAWTLLLAGTASAGLLQIPYAGGKQQDSIEIRVLGYHPFLGPQTTLGSISVEMGDLFSIRFREAPPEDGGSSFCSNAETALGKIFLQVSTGGETRQLADSGTNWDIHPVHPPDHTLIALPSFSLAGDSVSVTGYRFGSVGYCEGSNQVVTGKWNRIVFIRKDAHYAKFAMVAKQDTAWGNLPWYGYLKTITFRYVVNDSNDLSDPVSIRPERRPRASARLGTAVEQDHYNPLGVRLRRPPGRFEAAVPNSRSARPPRPEAP
jgi:hypothetical protein